MQIKGKTILHGIMDNPVSHSLSPAMHNSAFAALNLNCAYVPFPVEDVGAAMAGFRALGVRGVSVTIPHKQAVMAHLDVIDPVAEKIGAVNTLHIEGKTIKGLNTDWIGANRALETHINLQGKKVLLLGAGGSARAIGFGLLEAGAKVILASRTEKNGRELAEHIGCVWHPLDEVSNIEAQCLVNATSVGMTPNTDQSLVPASTLSRFSVVMDIVYAPLETKLLREAKEAGCQTVDGTAMLLYQGVAQFELWTGEKAPVDVMQQKLLAALTS